MVKTVKIWKVTGSPAEAPGHVSEYWAATHADAERVIEEHDLAEPACREVEVPLTRYGIAQALQGVVDNNCLNEH